MEQHSDRLPSPPKKSKLARAIGKVVNLQTRTKNFGVHLFKPEPHRKAKESERATSTSGKPEDQEKGSSKFKNVEAMEAFVARLFAGISSVKAAYAELQMAQFPYNSNKIQLADEAVVAELKALSEFKQRFLKKQVDLSPQVTMLLAEIQEQQSAMKTYEITLRKLNSETEAKDSEISLLRKQFDCLLAENKFMEKRLNSTGLISILSGLQLSDLIPSHFIQALDWTLRSTRSFVKTLAKEMDNAHWDLDLAANSIEPGVRLSNPEHVSFAFEAFVCQVMFDGFNTSYFSVIDEPLPSDRYFFFEQFKEFRSIIPKRYISVNPNSSFAKFVRSKYLNLVHPKMECSFFGNLKQRSVVNYGECPNSAFFTAFAEMAKRVWSLHSLGLAFEAEVSVFQVKKTCRFSEVYMEAVNEDAFFVGAGDLTVGFTVVPGFIVGKSVIQCQVYLTPADC